MVASNRNLQHSSSIATTLTKSINEQWALACKISRANLLNFYITPPLDQQYVRIRARVINPLPPSPKQGWTHFLGLRFIIAWLTSFWSSDLRFLARREGFRPPESWIKFKFKKQFYLQAILTLWLLIYFCTNYDRFYSSKLVIGIELITSSC